MDKIEQIIKLLKQHGETLSPLMESKIEMIENEYGASLPQVYRKVLLAMGRGAGRYMLGSSVFGNELYDLKEGAEELLVENGFKELPQNTFVFWMHQGYQFAFFYLNEGDDPPVYYFSEGRKQTEFEKIANSLSDFFEDQLSDLHIRL